MRVSPRLISAAAILLSLSGSSCAFRETGLERFPEPIVKLAVMSYTQEPDRCGPYALAAVLSFLHIAAVPEEISERLYIPKIRGTLTMDLYLEAVRAGAIARQVRGSSARIIEDLDREMPAILLLRYGTLASQVGHYVVISGYSLQPQGFFLLWGDGRESWMARGDLDRMWSPTNYWMLSFSGGGRS